MLLESGMAGIKSNDMKVRQLKALKQWSQRLDIYRKFTIEVSMVFKGQEAEEKRCTVQYQTLKCTLMGRVTMSKGEK